MANMNFDLARHYMVVQQIRPWDVLDEDVLEAMSRLPRENFVPVAARGVACSDTEIPIGQGQVMLAPKMIGRLLQAVHVQAGDKVLEVGTGTGYLTALLANLAPQGYVFSVDVIPEFTADARQRLAAQGIANITLETGNAAEGWTSHGPYDVIALTGSVPSLATLDNFRQSLKTGGRLFAVVGDAPLMEAVLMTRLHNNEWQSRVLFETEIPRLLHTVPRRHFAL